MCQAWSPPLWSVLNGDRWQIGFRLDHALGLKSLSVLLHGRRRSVRMKSEIKLDEVVEIDFEVLCHLLSILPGKDLMWGTPFSRWYVRQYWYQFYIVFEEKISWWWQNADIDSYNFLLTSIWVLRLIHIYLLLLRNLSVWVAKYNLIVSVW